MEKLMWLKAEKIIEEVARICHSFCAKEAWERLMHPGSASLMRVMRRITESVNAPTRLLSSGIAYPSRPARACASVTY